MHRSPATLHGQQLHRDAPDVAAIVDTTVVLAQQLHVQVPQHTRHADLAATTRDSLVRELDVQPRLQVLRWLQLRADEQTLRREHALQVL